MEEIVRVVSNPDKTNKWRSWKEPEGGVSTGVEAARMVQLFEALPTPVPFEVISYSRKSPRNGQLVGENAIDVTSSLAKCHRYHREREEIKERLATFVTGFMECV